MAPGLSRLACLSLPLLALAACGSAGAPVTGEVHDPAEGVNRRIFAANQFLDRNLLAPVARTYRDNVPRPVRNSVGNFAGNLRQPMVLTNDLLQGNVTRAWATTRRFVVNSTAGVGGIFDVAEALGLPGHDADFGQTLGVWCLGPGPAVQLPILGHSNVPDAAGTVVGMVANPLSYVSGGAMSLIQMAGTSAPMVHGRAELLEATDALMASSLDPYAALRSAQAQRSARRVEAGIRGSTARVDITIEPVP